MTTGSSNVTLHRLASGEVGYACRCGDVHSGRYAFEDYQHHECLHDARLLALDAGQVMCPLCGMAWLVEPPSAEPA